MSIQFEELQVLNFEIDPSLNPFEGQYPIDKYLMFLKEIRESRGYEVTVIPPGTGFYRVDVLRNEDSKSWYNELCEFVVDKINDQAKMYGELYVYHSLVKVVEIYAGRNTLITFDVKDVKSNDLKSVQACIYSLTGNHIHIHGWRFKPSFDRPPPPSPFDRSMTIWSMKKSRKAST